TEADGERYRALLETTSDFVWEMDTSGRYTYCSPQMLKLWGIKPEEMIGRTPFDVMPEGEREYARAAFEDLVRSPRPFSGTQSSAVVDQGRLIYVETNGVPFFDGNGTLLGFRGISRDITERKLLEETLEKRIAERSAELRKSERQYHDLFEHMMEPLTLFEPIRNDEGRIIDFLVVDSNPITERAVGMSTSQYVGQRLSRAFPGFEKTPKFDLYVRVAETGNPGKVLQKAFLTDTLLETTVFPTGGGLIAALSEDVTLVRRAEDELRLSEERYRSLFENLNVGAIITEPILDSEGRLIDLRYLSVNRMVERIYGRTIDQIEGFLLSELFSPKQRPEVLDVYGDVVKTGVPYRGEIHSELLNGDFDISCFRITPDRLAITFADVTDRKRAESALRAERQRLLDVLETLPPMICLLSPDYEVLFANRSFRMEFGEGGGRRCYEYCFGQSAPCEFCRSFDVLKTGKPLQWQVTTPKGTTIRAYDFPFTDIDGRPLILEMDIDITEQVRAEEALRRAGTYNRSLIEASLDPLLTISEAGKITDVNKATELVTGRPREQLIGSDFCEFFTEPDKARDGYTQVLKDGLVTDYPLTIRHRDGKLTDVLYNAVVYADESGRIQGVFAAARDITERKKVEAKAERLAHVLSLMSGINEAIVRIRDTQTLYNEVCRIAVERGGLRMAWVGIVEEQTGLVKVAAAAGVVDGYLDDIRISAHDEAIGRGPTGRCIRENRHSTCTDFLTDPRMEPWREAAAKRRFVCSAAYPLRSGGRVVGAFTLYSGESGFFDEEETRLLLELADDISMALELMDQERARKAAEVALRLTADRLEEAQEIGRMGSWEYDLVTGDVTWSEQMFRIFGRDPALGSPSIEESFERYLDVETRDRARRTFESAVDEGRQQTMDGRILPADNRLCYGNLVVSPVMDDSGKVVKLRGTVRDITERFVAENALRDSEYRLRTAQDIGNIGDFVLDLATGNVFWSDSIYRMMDRSPLLGPPTLEELQKMFSPGERQKMDEALEAVRTTGERAEYDRKLVLPSGKEVYHHVVYVAVKDAQGKVVKIRGTLVDVTPLKVSQMELELALEQLKVERRMLEEKNIALREVLTQIESEKEAIRKRFTTNVEQAILPSLIRLSEAARGPQKRELQLLVREATEVVSPFIDTLRGRFASLSPREVEICRMIKSGLTSKEIAENLNIADKTVQKYRELIRRKLRLTNKDTNLQTFLKSMPT
ncbi:hypothetical protein C3F09_04700, partial [candidate division GN15 bacterium]